MGNTAQKANRIGDEDSTARLIESDDEFQDQEDMRCKLLQEARIIHRIVPRQDLGQIYSYLEANLDNKNRVQIVMQEFLRMELAPELCASSVSDKSSVANKSEATCENSMNATGHRPQEVETQKG